ncbi:MAG: phosphatidate cytidylyltransferase [Promethearchaeota archaeon]
MNPYFLPISALYFLYGVFAFIIGYQHRKTDETRESFLNDVMIGCIFIMCSVTYPFMYKITGLAAEWQNVFFLLSDAFILGFLAFLSFYIIQEYVRAKRDPSRLETRDYQRFVVESDHFKDDKKRDANRKLLHLIPVGVILIVYLFAFLLKNELIETGIKMLGVPISYLGFAYFLIVLIGYSFVAMFMLEDTLRLIGKNKYFYLTPDWAHKWIRSSLSANETQTFISSIPLVLCFMPFLFVSFPLFISVAFITSLADAAASIFGKRFGKHKIRINNKKSYEGLVVGMFSTFLAVFLTNLLIPDLSLTCLGLMIMSVGSAIIFGFIDVFGGKIVDNILNPLICGGFMVVISNIPFLITKTY